MDALELLLQSLPNNKWNLHEKVVCRLLQMKPKESLSVRNQLGQVISVLKKGFSGNKRASTYKPTKFGAIDLSEENIPNKLNIHYSSYGDKESFATDTLAVESNVYCIPRYFRFGPNVRITVQNQLYLLGHVTGDTRQGLDEEIRKRRQKTWKGWYDKFSVKKDNS
jgi:hypothetical protein